MRLKSGLLKAGCTAGLLAFVALLAGCAALPLAPAPPRAALTAFELEGRFSLRHEDNNYAGNLSWRHAGENNTLLLASPFGQGLAEISGDASGARLTTSDGKSYEAADVETLTRQVLGYPLPLVQLTDWVRGRSSAAGIVQEDAFGRPLRLRHEGWSIDYGYADDDPQAPPNRIFAERAGGLELRLRIDQWTSIPSAENKP